MASVMLDADCKLPKSQEAQRNARSAHMQRQDSKRMAAPRTLDGPQYTEARKALRVAAKARHAERGEHDSTDAAVVRRFVNVPCPATHDPYKDIFKTRTFGETGVWRS